MNAFRAQHVICHNVPVFRAGPAHIHMRHITEGVRTQCYTTVLTKHACYSVRARLKRVQQPDQEHFLIAFVAACGPVLSLCVCVVCVRIVADGRQSRRTAMGNNSWLHCFGCATLMINALRSLTATSKERQARALALFTDFMIDMAYRGAD